MSRQSIFKQYKNRLIEIRDKLLALEEVGDEAAETVVLDQTRQGRLSRMDALQQQAMSKATNARRQKKLRDIDVALQRIEQGEYGYCLKCDEDINPKRLEHNPTATLCIQCAEKLEK